MANGPRYVWPLLDGVDGVVVKGTAAIKVCLIAFYLNCLNQLSVWKVSAEWRCLDLMDRSHVNV